MAYVRVETSVPRHRKFVKAGPAPSWLWLCGNCYCQDNLTDGFIPEEALPYLGVKNAIQLADHLVKAGLWDKCDGGWHVHDYLDHNRSAAEVTAIRQSRAKGGNLGGRPKKNLPANLQETSKVSTCETSAVVVVGSASDSVVEEKDVRSDFDRFLNAYPLVGRKAGYLVETEFFDALKKAGSLAVMLEALENHKASARWQDGKIPGMDTWLREARWHQRLDPPKGKTSSWDNWRPSEAS